MEPLGIMCKRIGFIFRPVGPTTYFLNLKSIFLKSLKNRIQNFFSFIFVQDITLAPPPPTYIGLQRQYAHEGLIRAVVNWIPDKDCKNLLIFSRLNYQIKIAWTLKRIFFKC